MPSWIAELIDLEQDGDTFTAPNPEAPQGRLFGGLIAAQALAAAGRTVPREKLPQSLHAYFVRSGKPGHDVELVVERTRDGRSFDTRRVTAWQSGVVILETLISFHVAEPGQDWQPETLPEFELSEAPAEIPIPELAARFEIRVPKLGPYGFTGLPYWIRTRHPIEDDALTRACALAFMSDLGLMAAARPPEMPMGFGPAVSAASLDHTIWFHRPFVPERWHRYEAERVNFNDARGLAVGAFHDQDGVRVASMAQEALWRT
jgi:acyl-CoA thioesterase II